MAIDTVTDVPPLEREESVWDDRLVGTKEQLQAAGIGVGVAFPGEPGAQPRQITVLDPRGFKARIARASPRQGAGRYRVEIRLPAAETERRCAERQERERLERLREAAQAAGMTVEQWLLRDVPTSAAEFRDRKCVVAEYITKMIWGHIDGAYGYSFDAAARAQCEAITGAIMRLFEHGRIVFDKAAHEQAIARNLASGGIVRQAARPRPTLRVVKS